MSLSKIEHIVVVMMENRSLDNMLGWLYPAGQSGPLAVLPRDSSPTFNGLDPGMSNPSPKPPPATIPVTTSASSSTTPDPDPQETFDNVTFQIYGADGPDAVAEPFVPMGGFAINYATVQGANPAQIMEAHSTAQLQVLSKLAKHYAVSDAWFASVPSQTWPNRAFAHAGTSNGNVNNGTVPDPLCWNVPTIFNVLKSMGATWGVYSDALIAPSLTRIMFPKLWDPWLDGHFHGLQAFVDACASNTLPQYSFIEPRFVLDPNDQHPPHDVNAGEALLYEIWTAVSTSPGWGQTLLVITYDEHGGCYDHVLPPTNATPPDAKGTEVFAFDRFGVRVPTVVISPLIAKGTVFRSDRTAPYDHTSILATLRDWLGISDQDMLTSARIAHAPTLAQLITLDVARTDLPDIAPVSAPLSLTPMGAEPNDLQLSLVAGSARRFGQDPAAEVARISTRQHVVDYFKRRPSLIHS
ncbi:alkaline phosphatase family protein [Variovorax sp. J2P1-59]|uniref:alkaline phosphatase family protein n=1 Tax=Variovorax flavidus TaxID=3053501 RepID=UPI0025754D4B|nr:alkaline phosphatase family protein [Variovorax sp. J2P1-59]MDM0074854.1 alkaline phosphatase family protein [Variovorax sp. J2P1-59]